MTDTAIAAEEFKMTELGPLPPEWEVVRAVDYCSFERGTEPGSRSYNRLGDGPPFIRVGNIAAQMQELVYTTSPDIRLCAKKDVLMTFDGSPGVVTTGFEGAYSSGIRKVVSLNDNLDQSYLYFALQASSVQGLIEEHAVGVTIKHASKAIPHITIPFPPLPEQKKIAYVLSTVQAAISKTDAVIEATKELKKSLMKHLFTYGPVSIDEAESVLLKETEIGLVPEKWEVVKLGEVVRTQYGYTASACHEQIGPRFLRITDIDDDGNVNWSAIPYCMVSADDYHRFSLEDGDTVVARIGATTGKAYFAMNSPRSVFASYLIRLKIKNKDKVYPAFISTFTKSAAYWRQVNQSKGGKLKSGLSARQLENMLIPLPPFQIQQRSAMALSVIARKLEIEMNKKTALQTLFNTLLSNLMTGKIRVNNLEVPV